MLTYILRRLLLAIPMLIGSSLIVFSIFYVSNVDPVKRALGERSQNEKLVADIRAKLGLDRPPHERYLKFLGGVLVGDFGRSIISRAPVSDSIREHFPATLELALAALILSVSFGLIGGTAAALNRNTPIDYAVMGVALLAVSVPVFWLGLVLSYVFTERLDWLPSTGRYSLQYSGAVEGPTGLMLVDSLLARRFDVFADALRHLALPAIVLAAVTTAFVARMTRSSVLEVARQDFVRTAEAKGLGFFGRLKHILRNAMIPVVTIIGLEIPALLGGAVITETIFGWPGMGKFLIDSILMADITAVQGIIMYLTIVFIVVNLAVDVLYALIDPRLRHSVAS